MLTGNKKFLSGLVSMFNLHSRKDADVDRNFSGILGFQMKEGGYLFNNESETLLKKLMPMNKLSKIRRSVIAEYIHSMRGFTQSQKAELLLGLAKSKGLTDANQLSGTKLRGWTLQGNPPNWAIDSAFSLLIERGWSPTEVPLNICRQEVAGDAAVFALFLRWWILSDNTLRNIEQVLSSLPDTIDRDIAAPWVKIMAGHIGRNGNQMVCYISDKGGRALTPLKTSIDELRRDVVAETYGFDERKCTSKYFFCRGFLPFEELDALQN